MNWRDAVVLAGRAVTRRLGRTFLTVLGVALAATLLTALLTIANTAKTRVLGQLSKGGPLASIKVAANPYSYASDDGMASGRSSKELGDPDVSRIERVPDVVSAVPVMVGQQVVLPPAPPVDPFLETVVGVDLRNAEDLPITLLAGRLPLAGSLTEVAVTEGYLDQLGLDRDRPDALVGTELELGAPRVFAGLGEQEVRARWTRARVVGVVVQEAGPGDVLVPIEQARLANAWEAAGGQGSDRLTSPGSGYSGIIVVARGLDTVGAVRDTLVEMGYSASAPENLIASVQRYLHVVEMVLTGIGTIALIIASLGVASALLAAVRERRREIGVLKAIGARDGDVLRIFLIEASVLGLIGGMVGTAAGWGVARAVASVVNRYLTTQGLAGVRLEMTFLIVAGGIAGSTMLALLAGAVPALRAARLPARDAVSGP